MDDNFLTQINSCYKATYLFWNRKNIDYNNRYKNNNVMNNVSEQIIRYIYRNTELFCICTVPYLYIVM